MTALMLKVENNLLAGGECVDGLVETGKEDSCFVDGNEYILRIYKMAQVNHHDPYREVEMYLEQAQEEIGRAFADLEEFECNVSDESSDSWFLASETPQIEDNPIFVASEIPDAHHEFPRPPSGDMTLLSAWAESFLDEVNRTLQSEDEQAPGDTGTYPRSRVVSKNDDVRKGIRRGASQSFRCQSIRRIPLRRHWSCPNDLPFWSDDPSRYMTLYQESRLETLLSKLLRREVRDVEVQTSCENCSAARAKCRSKEGSFAECNRTSEETVKSKLLHRVRCETVRWLSDEDDSDCLESKELPKSIERCSGMARALCLADLHPAVREFLQKSPCSTISSSSHVSRHELESFLRKVELSVYQPPPESSDDSDERSTGSPQHDAITQTSPDISRSSSFTWVTECDCSEPDRRKSSNLSDDSFPSFSCSSDIPESTPSSSSSSESSERQTALVMSSSLSLSSLSSADKLSAQPPTAKSHQKPPESRILLREFKSSSAPLLPDRQRVGRRASESDQEAVIKNGFSHPRSHSARELSELEAAEACGWLRAAGFPQYAQMYEDNLFPIDISNVRKDHEFLDSDSIQSLFRRLNTLNKCARLKNDGLPRKSIPADDSDEEDHCALSENWQFQRSIRRWSRISPPSPSSGIPPISPKHAHLVHKYLSPSTAYCSSHDSVFLDDSPETARREGLDVHSVPMEECSANSSPLGGSEVTLERPLEHSPLRRTGSERLKDSAKAFLRRVESLKGKRKKKNREIVIIGSPVGFVDSAANPAVQINLDYFVDTDMSTPDVQHLRKGWHGSKDEAHSDSECSHLSTSPNWTVGETFTANGHASKERKGKRRNGSSSSQEDSSTSGNENSTRQQVKRTQWLSPDSRQQPEERHSLYDNVPAGGDNVQHSKSQPCHKAKTDQEQDSGSLASTLACISDQDTPGSQEEIDIGRMMMERRDSGVGSSLTRTTGGSPSLLPRWHGFPSGKRISTNPISQGCPVNSLSAPQLMVVRKFSLLKLTALMEKYSPSNRTGWNWGVPKFIRRIRAPDYKDKSVFGVPLLLIVQRTGHPIPPPILTAMRHLRKTALDSTGLFRKSGVRSRIQKLRNMTEANPESVSYENQQSYDVADMLKQYFRELPEALLTNKLSETFITIYQHIPEELRLEATQAAILLMPDENREALQSLLAFLKEVCEHSDENQMTATNLAVCFAPSLFHLNTPRSASVSPRRRKTVGIPDQRELNENRAAHECLTRIISEYKRIFTVPEDAMLHCRLSCLEQFEPAALEELGGSKSNWRTYMDSCIQDLLKEARDKFKGWVTVPQTDSVDLAYKKVGDGHPLRLWKISVEVEAPPAELLQRILRERHIWDENLLKWKVVTKLEKHAEIFQYVSGSIPPHSPLDFCVLRTWKTDLPKGTCVMVETSIDHSDAETIVGVVRGVVLASRYLIEPCGSGKSRITHISRIDTRGRSLDWYNKAYGHIRVALALKLRDSFKHGTEGPETKV